VALTASLLQLVRSAAALPDGHEVARQTCDVSIGIRIGPLDTLTLRPPVEPEHPHVWHVTLGAGGTPLPPALQRTGNFHPPRSHLALSHLARSHRHCNERATSTCPCNVQHAIDHSPHAEGRADRRLGTRTPSTMSPYRHIARARSHLGFGSSPPSAVLSALTGPDPT
jgi:hypothetical protein